MKIIVIFLGVLLSIVPIFNSNAQKIDAPQINDMRLGDSWEWIDLDPFTKVENSKYTLTVINVEGVLKRSNSASEKKFAIPLDKLVSGEQKSTWRPWHSFPLEVGKKWSHRHEWIREIDGVSGSTKQDAQVVSYEDIVVKAGKFKAFKIEYKGYFTNYQGGSGRQDNIYWYVPEIQSDVKSIQSINGKPFRLNELSTYTRATK